MVKYFYRELQSTLRERKCNSFTKSIHTFTSRTQIFFPVLLTFLPFLGCVSLPTNTDTQHTVSVLLNWGAVKRGIAGFLPWESTAREKAG